MRDAVARHAGLTLRTPEGAPYLFDAGALCLELLPTGGPGAFARWEVLHAPEDLAAWAARCRIAPVPELGLTSDDVTSARLLRNAMLGLAQARAHGRPLPPGDLEVVNTAAAGTPLAPVLAEDGTRRWATPAGGPALLSTVARDAVDLCTGPYAERIRECGAGDCFLLFVDTSRPGRRRWCAMQNCGNRHKVRAHRARHDEE